MRQFDFSIVVSGIDPESENFEDRLFEAGCGDATISVQNGEVVLDFAREAETFDRAVRSAMADARKAGASAARIETAAPASSDPEDYCQVS